MIPEPIIVGQQSLGTVSRPGAATGDQLPPGCTCTHYITVLIPGSTPPGLTRAVCDTIQCIGGGNPGAGCWVLRVEDNIQFFPCGGAYGPPPAGSTCGEPPGVGPNRYGITVRTYRWVRCKGLPTGGGGFGGGPIITPNNEPFWPEEEVVPNPAIALASNTQISIDPYNSRFSLDPTRVAVEDKTSALKAEYTTEEPRSQIYAVSWYPIAGNTYDWSLSGSTQVTDFTHVKPAVFLRNNYNEASADDEQWQVQVIRNQLTMLDLNNNLSNTNIKNIIPIRYQGGWLYGADAYAPSGETYNNIDNVNGSITIRSNTGHLIWPDNEIDNMQMDWLNFLRTIDGNEQNSDGLRIANTRILFDNESILTSGNFSMNKPYYDALNLDPRSSTPMFGVQSLKNQLGSITWDGRGIAFCGTNRCGFNSNYQVWNKSVEKITTAAISKALLTTFKDRYGVDARASNWESNITTLGDGYPDVNGHDSYHDNLFGDSANIVLYGWQSVSSSEAWCMNPSDDTRLQRITSGQSPFKWHSSPWNAFMISVQGVRSVKRGLMNKNLPNTSINAWIPAKDYGGAGDLRVGFVNTQYYDEMIRHASLTGIEFFGFFNDEFPDPISTTVTGIAHRAKRIEQFDIINKILVDINTKLGGYTPTTLDDSRVSYTSNYVMSGKRTGTGRYLWRVTPKIPTHNIRLNNQIISKIGSEIGVWITTATSIKPNITVFQ